MDSEKKLAHDLFQIYFLYNKKDLLKQDTPSVEGFNRSNYEVMFLLEDLGERPMSVIAKTLSYSKAYITSIADFLHSKGYLNRVPSLEDRRVILLSLTDEGQLFLNTHRESVELAIVKRLNTLNLDDVALMSGMAAEMVKILSKLPDSADVRYIKRPAERRIYMSLVTTKYFPVLVNNLEEIPEEFMAVTRPIITDGPFPYCIFVPGYVSNSIEYDSWLLIMDDLSLTVFEQKKESMITSRMPFKDIIYLERGCVLLNSWLDFKANIEGVLIERRIEFNTTREDLMQPIIDKIRAGYNPPADNPEYTEESLDFLKEADLKFFNFATLSLLPGRRIEKVIYQSEISHPVMHLFRKSIHDAHLTIISPQEIVDIVETGRIETAETHNQGAIWRYIPRKAVHTSAVTDGTESNTVELLLELEAGFTTAFVYTSNRKPVLEAYFQS